MISIHEPMTMATDYLITIAAAIFAARLWSRDRMWALAFVFTGLGAFFGGTYHGVLPSVSPFAAAALWKATVYAVGIASFFFLAGSHPRMAVPAALKLVVYGSWMIAHDGFLWVIADYGTMLILVGIIVIVRRGPEMNWVLGGIGLAVAGAGIQQSGFTIHRHFNHNDLYHLVQIAALWMLYRGALAKSGAHSHAETDR